MHYYRDYVLPNIENGNIINCKMQVHYKLQPAYEYQGKKIRPIEYISDFDILYKDGSFVVIDTKGMVKPMDTLKKKMFNYHYPDLNLIWIGYSKIDGGYVSLEVIEKGRKERKKAKQNNNK